MALGTELLADCCRLLPTCSLESLNLLAATITSKSASTPSSFDRSFVSPVCDTDNVHGASAMRNHFPPAVE